MARHERAFGPLKAGGRRIEWYRYEVMRKGVPQRASVLWVPPREILLVPESVFAKRNHDHANLRANGAL